MFDGWLTQCDVPHLFSSNLEFSSCFCCETLNLLRTCSYTRLNDDIPKNPNMNCDLFSVDLGHSTSHISLRSQSLAARPSKMFLERSTLCYQLLRHSLPNKAFKHIEFLFVERLQLGSLGPIHMLLVVFYWFHFPPHILVSCIENHWWAQVETMKE